MQTRRTFIRNAAAAGTLCAMNPATLMAAPAAKEIGIQLYSIRDLVSEDLPGCLEKLAGIGYSTIEAAGYGEGKFYGHTPAGFRDLVRGLGLNAVSSHSGLNMDNIRKTIEDTAAAGMKYLVQPFVPEERRKTIDAYNAIADELNSMGELCRASGLTLGYHNHAFEFKEMEGKVPYDVLLERTEGGLVTMQLDTYWMVYGGYRAEDYFRRFPGRFGMWHVKDMAAGESRESTEIGSGIIDFQTLYGLRREAGLECLIVEQEEFKMDPWKSLEISWKYLKNL